MCMQIGCMYVFLHFTLKLYRNHGIVINLRYFSHVLLYIIINAEIQCTEMV